MAQEILDSHVHLWASWAANSEHHAWMTPESHLAHQYSMAQYRIVTSAPEMRRVVGFVYVETDCRVEPPQRVTSAADERRPEVYALRAIDEMRFLRRLVEGAPAPGDGFTPSDGDLLKGIVAWAPIDRGADAFHAYVAAAREAAGAETWERVKGFRFLMQGMDQPELRVLVDDEGVHEVLGSFGEVLCFDIGVDQRQGGMWQLEMAAELIRRVRERGGEVTFILSESVRERYLGKPCY
jgi:L-rhamnono-1,4-lactonase